MFDEIGNSLPQASSEFNERKFQFILDYSVAERNSGCGDDMHYVHNRNKLVDAASELYDLALEKCQ